MVPSSTNCSITFSGGSGLFKMDFKKTLIAPISPGIVVVFKTVAAVPPITIKTDGTSINTEGSPIAITIRIKAPISPTTLAISIL